MLFRSRERETEIEGERGEREGKKEKEGETEIEGEIVMGEVWRHQWNMITIDPFLSCVPKKRESACGGK